MADEAAKSTRAAADAAGVGERQELMTKLEASEAQRRSEAQRAQELAAELQAKLTVRRHGLRDARNDAPLARDCP